MFSLVALCSISLALLLLFLIILKGKRKKKYNLASQKIKRVEKSLFQNRGLYNKLKQKKILSSLLGYVEGKESSYRMSETTTKKHSAILLKSLAIFLISSLLLLPLASNIHILIGSAVALCFVFVSSVDFFLTRDKTRLLEDFVYFLELFRTKYFESNLKLDSALFETIQALDEERYGALIEEVEYILSVVESPNSELELRDYYQIAPNSYFKIYAGLLAINKENGDVIQRDGSSFAKALSELSGEIKDEIVLRDRLNYSLRSLTIIALLPLFTLDPIKKWAMTSFYPLRKFFSSQLGINTEIVLILVILTANYFLSKLKAFDLEARQLSEHNLFMKLPRPLKQCVLLMVPEEGSRRYLKKEEKMKRAMDFSPLKVFYSKKLMTALGIFILIISIALYSNYLTRRSILEEPTVPKGYMGGELSGKELERAREVSLKDKPIVLAIVDSKNTDEETEAIMRKIEESFGDDEEVKKENLARIVEKARAYQEARLNFKAVLIAYGLALLAFQIPDFALLSRTKLLKLDSIAEVSKFQLIILLLMHIKSIELSDLLEWMEMFALIYKKPLQDCILDYDSGSEEALRLLKERVEDEEFKKIIEHMMSAANKLSIEVAFQDLENEKKYYEMKRKTMYERIVDKKSAYGRFVGFIPVYSVILLYFMFPLIYSGFSEINNYFGML